MHGRRLVHRRPLARLASTDRAERVDKLDQGAVLRPPVLRLAHLAARAAATGRTDGDAHDAERERRDDGTEDRAEGRADDGHLHHEKPLDAQLELLQLTVAAELAQREGCRREDRAQRP